MDGLWSVVLDVAAALLIGAGATKVLDPRPTARVLAALGRPVPDGATRLIGVAEIALGAAALLTASAAVAALVSLTYLGFAAFVLLALRRDVGSCGCFGTTSRAPSVWHVAGNLALAVGAGGAAIAGVQSVADQPLGGVAAAATLLAVAVRARTGDQRPRASGSAAAIGEVDLAHGRTALLFLTTTCLACHDIWDALAREGTGPGVRAVAVVQDAEPAERVAALAPAGLTVVRDSAAWAAYGVTVAPAVVLVDDGEVVGSGLTPTWADVVGLTRTG